MKEYPDKLCIGKPDPDEQNNLLGWGIEIGPDYHRGDIMIGCWKNLAIDFGNHIIISRWGEMVVNQVYQKEGKQFIKGTEYKPDGSKKR